MVLMYVRFLSACGTLKTCCSSAGSTLVMRRSGYGKTGLGRCSQVKSRRKRVSRIRDFRHWRWHLDERCVKLNGEMVYLWCVVDQGARC